MDKRASLAAFTFLLLMTSSNVVNGEDFISLGDLTGGNFESSARRNSAEYQLV